MPYLKFPLPHRLNCPLFPALLLAGQPDILPLLPCHIPPFVDGNPANVRPIPKAPNPIDILHYQTHPLARMDRVARQPLQ